ncbi:MAG: L-threonylcarbamoyladenylate synthase [Ignavibacteriaceae bacterium]
MPGNSEKIINIEELPEKALQVASNLYHSGKVFIYPTDTIYGIGGSPFDQNVVRRIAEIKGRNESKQFIWLIDNIENMLNYVEIVIEKHLDFLQSIWPAPVSVVLNLNERTKRIVEFETIAVRIPKNNFCQELLKEIGQPLISTSVNRSGQEPVNNVEELGKNFLAEVDAIIFSKEQVKQTSSTILNLTSEEPKLIREGAIKFVELLKNLN